MNWGSSSILKRRNTRPTGCYARILSDLEEKTITFIVCQQALQLLVSILHHCAKLQHENGLPSIPMRSEE